MEPTPAAPRRAGPQGAAAQAGECITVFARVRPSEQPSPNLDVRQEALELAVPRGPADGSQADQYAFRFAEVFGPQSSQQYVFDRIARDLVVGALDGINCTMFAYGQTGSGKTFTMCGGKGDYARDKGIIPRTLGTIFEEIEHRADGIHYTVSMSMIEIYKEIGHDLLVRDFGRGPKRLPTVTVSVKGEQSVLQGAKRVALASEEEGLNQYFLGDLNRTVAATPHNLASSRSHCVCTVFVEATDPAAQVVRTSKIQIVDLAGSERLKPYEEGSQSKKGLMKEAVSINLSLHYLSVVITALNDNAKPVPYRNSFLTKLLMDALGGNAKAAMVMTVNPSDAALPETLCSCRFAQRVANVQTNARVNEERDPHALIEELKRRNAELQAAASGGGGREPEVPEEELRGRVRAFLEDERAGAAGGSTLKVGPMPSGAFAAFRIFRELFWEGLLDGRRGGNAGEPAAGVEKPGELQRETSWLTAAEQLVSEDGEAAAGGRGAAAAAPAAGAADAQRQADCQALLLECQAECRMLRAALAAQPAPRPLGRTSSRPSREAKLQIELVACRGEIKKLKASLAALASANSLAHASGAPRPRRKAKAKPKRAASVDRRQDTLQSTSDFSSQDFSDTRPRRPTSVDRRQETLGSVSFRQEDVRDSRSWLTSRAQASPRRSLDSTVSASSSTQPSDYRPASGRPEARAAAAGVPSASSSALASTTASLAAASAPSPDPRPVAASAAGAIGAATGGAAASGAAAAAASAAAASAAAGAAAAPRAAAPGGASAAWLAATAALTEDELAECGSDPQAYQVFLKKDPRAGDIWPSELRRLRAARKACAEEARGLGESVEQTKEAMRNVQVALDNLKGNLREAEAAASVDASAGQRAEMLRGMIAAEEPRLAQLLEEKQQQYRLDFQRLKELRHEVSHHEHAQKKLEGTVQTEFRHWLEAVEHRYPQAVAAARAEALADEAEAEEAEGG